MFDLPAQEVTKTRLRDLYAQHEDELTGAAPPNDVIAETATAPVVMHCR
jgi:phosphonate transport system ATP-binding protein